MTRSARPEGVLHHALELAPSLEKEMALLGDFVGPGDVCLDVGASYGIYAVALSRLVGPTGRVHAFEPRPRSVRVLRMARRLLTRGNVDIHRLALSDRDGVEMIVTPRRRWLVPVPGRTFLKGGLTRDDDRYPGRDGEFGSATEIPVTTTTLDGFVARAGVARVAFVKVDVEGAERQVFTGARTTLGTHRPVVLCELEDRHTRRYGHRADDVITALVDQGYQAYVFAGGGLRKTASVSPWENNYLFLPVEGGRRCGTADMSC